MGFQFLWDDAYKNNPSFYLDYPPTSGSGSYYKVSDQILTEEDLIGQTVTYYDSSWKIKTIGSVAYTESGSDKIIEVGGMLISGPAGSYCVRDDPRGSLFSTYAELPEPGTYICRSSLTTYHALMQVQSIGLYDEFSIDWGFTDGGEGDALTKNALTVPQGYQITGALICQTFDTKDYEEIRFRWYRYRGEDVDAELVQEDPYSTNKHSDFVPPTDTIGTRNYYCVARSISGLNYKTEHMTVTVVEPEPEPEPEPDIENGVTGIELAVTPEIAYPGGYATVTIKVNGVGKYSKEVTTSCVGNLSTKTKLLQGNPVCNVFIGYDERATYLFFTAKSVENPEISASIKINIDKTGSAYDTEADKRRGSFLHGCTAARAYFRHWKFAPGASINVVTAGEPSGYTDKVKRSFWKGFVSGAVLDEKG